MSRVRDDTLFGLALYPQPAGTMRCGNSDFTVIGQVGGADEEQILLGDDGRVMLLEVGSQELSGLNSSLTALKPAAAAPAPLPHQKRVKQLRKTLKATDPAAIKPGTWWGFILEQLDGDLL